MSNLVWPDLVSFKAVNLRAQPWTSNKTLSKLVSPGLFAVPCCWIVASTVIKTYGFSSININHLCVVPSEFYLLVISDYISCAKQHGLKHSGIFCFALKHFERFYFNMVQPSKLAFSIMCISINTAIQCMKNSAQQRLQWALQGDVFLSLKEQQTIKRPMMKQAFQNAWNALKRYFRCWSQCQRPHLRPWSFWSGWSFSTRSTHCKKKWSKRISLCQEIALKHFVILSTKRFKAEMFHFKLKHFVSNWTWFEHKELTIWT